MKEIDTKLFLHRIRKIGPGTNLPWLPNRLEQLLGMDAWRQISALFMRFSTAFRASSPPVDDITDVTVSTRSGVLSGIILFISASAQPQKPVVKRIQDSGEANALRSAVKLLCLGIYFLTIVGTYRQCDMEPRLVGTICAADLFYPG